MRKSYFKVKKPCKECPFVRGCIPGWLGPDTAEEVMQKVHSEQGYVCHMSIEGKESLADGTIDIGEHGHQCIGALMHATESAKSYRDPELRDLQNKLKVFASEFAGKILDRITFREYHAKKKRSSR